MWRFSFQNETKNTRNNEYKPPGLCFCTIPTIFPKVHNVSLNRHLSRIIKTQMTMRKVSPRAGLFFLCA